MAGKVFYRKLIRDNIPEKIRQAGSLCEVRTLSSDEYEEALFAKVAEEASGVVAAAPSRTELLEELADLYTVLEEIRVVRDISDEELETAYREGMRKKGGFTKRLFLEWSSDDGYSTNENKG